TGGLDHPLGVRVVPVQDWVILDAVGPGSGNNGLQRTHQTLLERARDATGEGQFVERVNPVGLVIELPVSVPIALLQRVPGAHTQLNWNDIGLRIRKVVGWAGKVRRVAICSEDVARYVVTGAHGEKRVGIGLQDCAELCMTVAARYVIDGGDS